MVVTVAPKGYTGQADYYCDGVNDDVLINAAIQYVFSAYAGGTVHLLEGTFISSGRIVGLGGVTLSGSGRGTVVQSSALGAAIYFTVNDGAIADLTVDAANIVGPETPAPGGLLGSYAIGIACSGNKTQIRNVRIINGPSASLGFYGIYISGDDTLVSGCFVDGNLVVVSGITKGISANGNRTIINGCSITQLRSTLDLTGIEANAGSWELLSNNSVYDISTSGAAAKTYGIYCNISYCSITGNKVQQGKNSTTAANAYGVYINGGTSTSVTSNYCYNNGSDAGIDNTNGNNFADAGTDTQVYSNSWQSPVTGEPSLGTPHEDKGQQTAHFVNAIQPGAATWYTLTFANLPAGTKGVWAFFAVQPVAGAGDNLRYRPYNNGDTYAQSYHRVLANSYNSAGTGIVGGQALVPVDSQGRVDVAVAAATTFIYVGYPQFFWQ